MHREGLLILLWPALNPSFTSLAVLSLLQAPAAPQALCNSPSPLLQLSCRACSAASAKLHFAFSPGGASDNP